MNIVMTGGNGYIGRRLARRLLDAGLAGERVGTLVLFDIARLDDELAGDPRVEQVTGDVADLATVERVIAGETTAVFHFGAVVSAGAEADFDLGMRVNLDGTRNVLEACRRLAQPPRVVFASSLAVYGGALPPIIDDVTPLYPQTSYGMQKACGEFLVSDYTRKGFIDGRALRSDDSGAARTQSCGVDVRLDDHPRTAARSRHDVPGRSAFGDGGDVGRAPHRLHRRGLRASVERLRRAARAVAPGDFGVGRRDDRSRAQQGRRSRGGTHQAAAG